MGNVDHIATMLMIILGVLVAILAMIYVIVPLLKGFGMAITGIFKVIGWLVLHVLEYVGGTLSDVLRFAGAVLAMVVLAPLAPLNVIIGRWSAAGHFAESVKRECKVAFLCVYRVLLQRPLKLFWLHGLLEGIEQRVPEAFAAAPTREKPSRRTGTFDGYTIVGSLRSGGSGGKLYIAEPDARKQAKLRMPDRVVIKSFAISDGSSLPQIVRESRALEAAKQLGLVLEHGMDEHRFWYAMPYLAGDNLGMLARHIHAESGERGLTKQQLSTVMSYMRDLLETLSRYHDGGLWHKDVKPDNIIINEQRAHLVDLGLVTPLHSAMTLTTHGTEYFRDPEMVRQALRGVKVHQVNGAKFDIFAAGAVLYFVLENTFPAHGGLSRFSKPSPEALRWIVRRAMAEYNKRYNSVDVMLADLAVVMRASDPFAIKPVDLPSMSGGDSLEDYEESDASDPTYAFAGQRAASPRPPHNQQAAAAAGNDDPSSSMRGWGVRFGSDGVRIGRFDEGQGAKAKRGAADNGGGQAVPAVAPRLRVTNWWTGAYQLDPADSVHPAASAEQAQHRAYRQSAQRYQQEADALRRQVQSGRMTPRQAARAQIKAARQRAKDMRSRAYDRRRSVYQSRSVAERQPSLALIGATALGVLLLLGVIAFFVAMPSSVTISNGRMPAANAHTSATNVDPGPPVLLVPYNDADDDWSLQADVQRALQSYNNRYHLVHDLQKAGLFRELLEEWRARPAAGGAADTALEDALEAHNLYGALEIRPVQNNRGMVDVRTSLVYSTRPDADERRRPVSAADGAVAHAAVSGTDAQTMVHIPASTTGETIATRLLLINDHPARTNQNVMQQIDDLKSMMQERGWTVIVDDDIEPVVRAGLPIGPLGMQYAPEKLARTLLEHGLGGIMRLTAGETREDVSLTHALVPPDMLAQWLADAPPEAATSPSTAGTSDSPAPSPSPPPPPAVTVPDGIGSAGSVMDDDAADDDAKRYMLHAANATAWFAAPCRVAA